MALAALFAGAPAPADARSLARKLHQFVQDNTSIVTLGGVADFVTPAIERLAIRGIDFPHTSTAPGFTYRFDFESASYVREVTALGPVFAERPETIGRRRLEIGLSFLWGDLDEVDGGTLGTASTGRFRILDDPGVPLDVSTALTFERFSLRTAVWGFSGTYGLTDRWDVNVLLPVIYTQLSVDALRQGVVRGVGGQVLARDTSRVGLRGEALGPGDLLLRTKYRLLETGGGRFALGLTVKSPTGSETDFQGLGDWTVTPTLVAAREVRRTHLHASVGFEVNADDSERNRVRYAAGATLPLWRRLGVFADLLGSSGTSDDDFVLQSLFPAVSPPSRGIGIRRTDRTADGTTTVAFVPRSDVIDVAVGVKFEGFGRVVLFAGALVPVTDDGLRADVVPTGGAQLAF